MTLHAGGAITPSPEQGYEGQSASPVGISQLFAPSADGVKRIVT